MNWENKVRQALSLDVPYLDREDSDPVVVRARVIEQRGRQAAVLVLLGFRSECREPEILLTRRADHLLMHAGQMAFPGGASDPEDHDGTGPSPVRTALRETHEEVGLAPRSVRVIGNLPSLFTFASDFWVTPVVGFLESPIDRVQLVPSQDEIASLHWVPMGELLAPGSHRLEPVEFAGRSYSTHVYQVQGQRIWGATAAMIHNFLQRLSG